jgi:hypothetical protein
MTKAATAAIYPASRPPRLEAPDPEREPEPEPELVPEPKLEPDVGVGPVPRVTEQGVALALHSVGHAFSALLSSEE